MAATVASSPPRPSKAAGGEPIRIAYFSAEWVKGSQIQLGGADYWRLALPGAMLLQSGWDVMLARCVASAPDGTLQVQDPNGVWHDDREIVVWQRWMGEGTAEALRRARAVGQVVINDVDDHYWGLPASHIAERGSAPDVAPQFNRDHYRETIGASSLVTVSTAHLARTLESWGPPVELIRNYIDPDFFPSRMPSGDFVGWVGGIPWRGNDLQLLRDTVIPRLKERGEFFYHGGQLPGDYVAETALDYERITTRPISDLGNYPRLWEPLRTALIPIEDSAFGRAKSWVKGLEACARGVPFIVSDHEEYREFGAQRIVREPSDWTRHLDELEDPEVYQAECEANRAHARKFLISEHWTKWDATFREALRVRS